MAKLESYQITKEQLFSVKFHSELTANRGELQISYLITYLQDYLAKVEQMVLASDKNNSTQGSFKRPLD